MTVTVDESSVSITLLEPTHAEGNLSALKMTVTYVVEHDLNEADPMRRSHTDEIHVLDVLTQGEQEHFENILDRLLVHARAKTGAS